MERILSSVEAICSFCVCWSLSRDLTKHRRTRDREDSDMGGPAMWEDRGAGTQARGGKSSA